MTTTEFETFKRQNLANDIHISAARSGIFTVEVEGVPSEFHHRYGGIDGPSGTYHSGIAWGMETKPVNHKLHLWSGPFKDDNGPFFIVGVEPDYRGAHRNIQQVLNEWATGELDPKHITLPKGT